jgi:hypothetical protein
MSMKTIAASLSLAFYFACSASRAEAESTDRNCPVVIDRVELSYSHQGEPSQPQIKVWFENSANKPIVAITFSLLILNSSGDSHPYPDELSYVDDIDTGEKKVFQWKLTPELVDIHRAGETVVVEEVEFASAASWKDDGLQSCALKVDYQAR